MIFFFIFISCFHFYLCILLLFIILFRYTCYSIYIRDEMTNETKCVYMRLCTRGCVFNIHMWYNLEIYLKGGRKLRGKDRPWLYTNIYMYGHVRHVRYEVHVPSRLSLFAYFSFFFFLLLPLSFHFVHFIIHFSFSI